MDILTTLDTLSHEFYKALQNAKTHDELESVRVSYLGRKGSIAALMSQLKDLEPDEKREIGPRLNTFKKDAQTAFEKRKNQISATKSTKAEDQFDVTAYYPQLKGSLHPYTHIIEEIQNIFISMGFAIVEGPEVETPFYNFEALNIPEDHPARDMHDTFWLELPNLLLRTHTSSVQIRTLENTMPPVAICSLGRTYRHEATDATHDFVFNQVEGLLIDKDVSLSHLLGLMKEFFRALFHTDDLKIRVRPSYFPFVEPGLELDMSCPFCTSGCSTCKQSKWIEIGGTGLVHPNVLKACNLDPNEWGGFAFGMGIERIAMLKYGINDIRLFKSGRIDFLNQF